MNTEKYKKMLEEELKEIEAGLKSIGRINPDNPKDWEAVQPEMNVPLSDRNDRADVIEEYEEDSAILKELEIRYNNIKRALKKIEDGTYGKDEIDGTDISEDRLNANPSARTKVENA